MVDWTDVDTARSQAQSATSTANEWAGKGNVLADELRKAVGERFGESTVAKDSATARGNFMAALPQARADVLGMVNDGSILSPTQQNAILSAKRAAALIPVMGTNLMEQAAFGTMEDLINAGTHAWNAQSQAAADAAKLASSNYTSLLSELVSRAQEERAAASASREAELFPIQKATALAQLAKLKSGAGEGTSLQWQEAGGKAYTFNPKTGKVEEIKGVSSAKYGEQDIANFANAIVDQSMKITAVPMEIRGSVQQLADQIIASKPSAWQQFTNWIGGMFQK